MMTDLKYFFGSLCGTVFLIELGCAVQAPMEKGSKEAGLALDICGACLLAAALSLEVSLVVCELL